MVAAQTNVMAVLVDGMPGVGGYREHDILVGIKAGANKLTGFPYKPEHNIVATQ